MGTESMNLTQKQLDGIVSRIDDKFDMDLVAIHQRPMRAVLEVFNELNISGVLFGGSKQPANLPITAQNLSSHVTKWYDERYGDALKVDMSVGRFPFQLKGVFYACKLPLIYGSVQVTASKLPLDSKGVLNVFDLLLGLPKYVREKSTSSDENRLMYKFEVAMGAMISLKAHKNEPLINCALSDALVSCDQLTSNNANFSLSAWHSLQFAEKVVKYYINQFEEPKFTHEIKKLRNKAKSLGYIDEGHVNWKALDFKPCIRYDPSAVTQSQAIEANLEAWKVAFDIMRQTKA
ncbi:hypothetical protein ACEWBL_23205 [Vibrio parahaemolyticus]